MGANTSIRDPEGAAVGWSTSQLKILCQAAAGYKAEIAMSKVRDLMEYFRQRHGHLPLPSQQEVAFEQNVRLLLFRLNPTAKLIKADAKYIRFRAPALQHVPRLPAGYGFKGGVARLALETLLGLTGRGVAPRDLDIVRFGSMESRRDKKLALKYMPEDARHGYGVELLAGLDEYMSSRDITVNQVLLMGAQVICSHQALQDMLAGILRPCSAAQLNGSAGRILVKMLRLKAEARVRGQFLTLQDSPSASSVKPFDVAMHLGRALSLGRDVGEYFVDELRANNLLPLSLAPDCSVDQAVQALGQAVPSLVPVMRAENQDGYVCSRLAAQAGTRRRAW